MKKLCALAALIFLLPIALPAHAEEQRPTLDSRQIAQKIDKIINGDGGTDTHGAKSAEKDQVPAKEQPSPSSTWRK